MTAKKKGNVRLTANVPEVIVKRWEDLLIREYGSLPFDMRGRVELAILEHTRVIQRRLDEDSPSSGGAGGNTEQRRRFREGEREEGGPEQWHDEGERPTPNSWQDYLRETG